MTKLTNKLIADLPIKTATYIVWDDEIKGLGIRVNDKGRKSFILKYRVGQGRRSIVRKPNIGVFGVMVTDQARRKAKQWLVKAAEGLDPSEKNKSDILIKEFCQEYLIQHAEVKKKASSTEEDKRLMKLIIIPAFGKYRLRDITRAMVIKLHHSLKDTPYRANRFVALLSTMMNLAEKWEYRPQNTNPCKYVDRYKEKPREVYLTLDQLESVGQAMRQLQVTESVYVLSAIQMLIVTACRTAEILTLKWEYIDFKSASMKLPDTKTGERTVHLNPTALEILSSLERKLDYVFASRVQDKRVSTVRHTWMKICKLANITNVRPHDLRHTFASHAVNNGFSLPIIAKMLGHKDLKTTQRYAHLHQDPVNKASDDVSSKIRKVMEME